MAWDSIGHTIGNMEAKSHEKQGLDKYEQKVTSAEKYYDLFLKNNLKNRSYKIKLTDNNWYTGIPTASTFSHPYNSGISFNFKTEDGKYYSIPFSDLIDVQIVP